MTAMHQPDVNSLGGPSPAAAPRARSWIPLEGSIHLPVYLLAAFLPVRGLESLGIAMPLPTNTVAALLLLVLALVWRPRWKFDAPLLVTVTCALLLWLVAASLIVQGDVQPRRFFNLLSLVLIAGVIGSGRLPMRSLTRGMMMGLVIALGVSIILLPRSSYAGRLTGLLADPNAAGYTLVTLGLGLAQSVRSVKRRWMFIAVVAAGTVLTVSRTSMFALTIGLIWVLVGRRLNAVVGALGLGGVVWLYQFTTRLAERHGLFVDRAGSDALRERLLFEERRLVDSAGWVGHGLGSNVVQVDESTTLFFHNSYLALQSEGGRIALGLVILLLVALYLRYFQLPGSHRPVWSEASLVASAICAFNIGFALTSPPFAVAVGLFLAYQGFARESLSTEGDDPMLTTRVAVSELGASHP